MDLITQLKYIFEKNLPYVFASLIGYTVAHIKNREKKKVLSSGTILTSAIVVIVVGYITSTMLHNFTTFNNDIIFVIVLISGIYHDKLLNEVEGIIPLGNLWVRKMLGLDTEVSNDVNEPEYDTNSDEDNNNDKISNEIENEGGL